MTILVRIFWLFVGHAVCDFAFQSQFMAENKNPFKANPQFPWFWIMFPHCLLHAGAVYFITGSLFLAIAELVVHFGCDVLKCKDETTFGQDQMLHYGFKIILGVLAS